MVSRRGAQNNSLLDWTVMARHCIGVLLDGRPCGPTGASPGFNFRQQPLTMSPSGKFTCAEYGKISLRTGSVHEAFLMVADKPKPLVGASPFSRCQAQTFSSGTQKKPPRKSRSGWLMPRYLAPQET